MNLTKKLLIKLTVFERKLIRVTEGLYTPEMTRSVLFIMLYKVVLNFESMDETPWCDHLNEASLAALPHDT